MIAIRPEILDDYPAIGELIVEAFQGEGHDEARLVEATRQGSDFTPELSLVAIKDGQVVGHVLFTPATIQEKGGATPILALAPLAVHPEHQRQGIGSELVRRGLEACRRRGHSVVTVAGSPRFYGRLGFSRASDKGLRDSLNTPEEHFQVIELVPGALEGISGVVIYPPVWDAFGLPS